MTGSTPARPAAPGRAAAAPGSRVDLLGLPVDLVTMDEAVDRLVEAVEARRRGGGAAGLRVATLNPEMVMRARRDPALGAALERAGLSIPDGVGVVWALRRRGHTVDRVAGVDLVSRYAERAAALGHRLALVGAHPGVAAAAAGVLAARHPGLLVVATDSGDARDALAARLRRARPDVVLAAYSMEDQACFLDRHLDSIGSAAGIGVGGTFDILAGRLRRAPAPVRRAGLEWAWRLVLQPRRWRRQLDLVRFVLALRSPADPGPAPAR